MQGASLWDRGEGGREGGREGERERAVERGIEGEREGCAYHVVWEAVEEVFLDVAF